MHKRLFGSCHFFAQPPPLASHQVWETRQAPPQSSGLCGLPCRPASLHVVSACAPGPPRSPPRSPLLLHLLFPPLEPGSLPVCAFVFLPGTQISAGGLTWGPLTPGAPFCGHTSGSLSLRSVPRDAICGESFFRALTCRCQSLTRVTLLSTGRL